ncbi:MULTISPECIES: hypothetical protein [Pantoea]|uniref:hypothetical protein n=1 Tax=Pantoea TaxID=53335 RepID=UPI000AD8D10E|nr:MULTISPECIES: hypothetical protein [Pantoea]MDI9223192.1 hypothetical protein [Pantoea sp. EA-12]
MSLRFLRKKRAGIWLKAAIFLVASRFRAINLQIDRKKILRDPCALPYSPYNSPPGIIA